MSRRGENIYKRRDGRWEGRYIKARHPDGKAVYASVYGKKLSEVRQKLIPLKADLNNISNNVDTFTGTVQDWLSTWLENSSRPVIKPSTYANYRSKLEKHVLPTLGDKELISLNAEKLQIWVEHLLAKGLSAASIRTVHRVLSSALQKAVVSRVLTLNPCVNVQLPSGERKRARALTMEQQNEIEQKARQSKGNEATVIALYSGMRIGEISALTWENVDFENNQFHVCRTLQRITDYEVTDNKTKVILDIPKSDMSYRTIPFGINMRNYLLSLKARSESDYVVCCKGSYAEPRVLSYRFNKLLEGSEIVGITFHSLRHTYATRCVERNIDIVTLSRLLGHASAKMTLDTYAHSTMAQRKLAMASLDLLFENSTACEEKLVADECAVSPVRLLLAT